MRRRRKPVRHLLPALQLAAHPFQEAPLPHRCTRGGGASAGTYLALAALGRLVVPCSKLAFAGWWATTAAPRPAPGHIRCSQTPARYRTSSPTASASAATPPSGDMVIHQTRPSTPADQQQQAEDQLIPETRARAARSPSAWRTRPPAQQVELTASNQSDQRESRRHDFAHRPGGACPFRLLRGAAGRERGRARGDFGAPLIP